MNTYQEQIENAISSDVIPPYWLGYFREAFRETINEQLLELYLLASSDGLTKKVIAQKLGRRPEQITRWLATPNNLEVDTVSDLALALGCVPVFALEKVTFGALSQEQHPLSETTKWEEFETSSGYVTKIAKDPVDAFAEQ